MFYINYGILSSGSPTYTSRIPTLDTSHVKATTYYSASFYPHFTCDTAKSLIGDPTNNAWYTTSGSITNQRFHIDLGTGYVIKRIYYENGHFTGAELDTGAENFTFWGSNSATAFDELTYATDTDWTSLTIAQSTFDQHTGANTADPKYILVTNSTSYRYYAFKFADNYGDANYMSIRRIELQTQD